jgi:hypothetical protein
MEIQRQIVVGVIVAFVVALVYAGLVDLVLFVRDEPTVTQFLRKHPRYYWVSLAAFLGFAAALGLHLYLETLFYRR